MSVQQLLTPFLVGALLNAGASGWTASQSLHYFTNFPNDHKAIRWTVAALLTLDIAYTCIAAWLPYDWLILHWGEPQYSLTAWNPVAGQVCITGLVTFITQTFFAYRVFIVSKRQRVIPCLIVLSSFISCTFAIATAAMVVKLRYVPDFAKFTWGINIWLFGAVVADMAISSSLFFWLGSAETNHVETKMIVRRLLVQVVETNFVTACIAVVDAAVFVGLPGEAWHIIPNTILGKAYFLSLLVSLNSRKRIAHKIAQHRQDMTKVSGGGGGMQSIHLSGIKPSDPSSSCEKGVRIEVETDTVSSA